jgi:hypothetical protein
MNRMFFGCLALGLTVAGCAKDPTSDLGGTPSYITAQYSAVTLDVGDSLLVLAETRDGQGVVLEEVPVASSQDAAVATVADAYLPPLAQARFFIKAVATGATTVTLSVESAPSVRDSIVVTVN